MNYMRNIAVLGLMALLSGPLNAAEDALGECHSAFSEFLVEYLAAEISAPEPACYRTKGAVVVDRVGSNSEAAAIFFEAWASASNGRKCYLTWGKEGATPNRNRHISLTNPEFREWKKFLGNEGCDTIMDTDEEKIVFATSTASAGDLIAAAKDIGVKGKIKSGLAAADKICNKLADDAGLPGSYTAWLSDSTADARDRITQSTVPYVRTDSVKVADDFTDLVNCSNPECLQASLNVDENGNEFFGTGEIWTGTVETGVSPGDTENCADWSSSSSDLDATVGWRWTDHRWTNTPYWSCSEEARLYCFQD